MIWVMALNTSDRKWPEIEPKVFELFKCILYYTALNVVHLFDEKDTRDELGIGSFRERSSRKYQARMGSYICEKDRRLKCGKCQTRRTGGAVDRG